jgi:hypothetical protein
MSESRSSRLGWPTPAEPSDRGPRQRRIGVLIVYAAVILNLVLTMLVFSYVQVLKASRDTEQQRIEQRIDLNNCALLDNLPAYPDLRQLRATYHCGPGLPRP